MYTLEASLQDLFTLFIEKNLEFTTAMREKRPHSDLKVIYEGITALNEEINYVRSMKMTA